MAIVTTACIMKEKSTMDDEIHDGSNRPKALLKVF